MCYVWRWIDIDLIECNIPVGDGIWTDKGIYFQFRKQILHEKAQKLTAFIERVLSVYGEGILRVCMEYILCCYWRIIWDSYPAILIGYIGDI